MSSAHNLVPALDRGAQRSQPLPLPEDERSGAYRWWYFDALSDDERSAFSAIFLLGSIFSPSYAARLARGEEARPHDHVGTSFVYYRRGELPIFCFSEYGADRLARSTHGVRIARSSFERERDGAIVVRIEETRVALRAPVRATFRFDPREPSITARPVHLSGREHAWHGIVPRARVVGQVEGGPGFEGTGYHDTNFGSEPPARLLASWSWGRVHDRDGTNVFFDVKTVDGRRSHEHFLTGGVRRTAVLPPRVERPSLRSFLLPTRRRFEAEPGRTLSRVRPLERGPFYTRFVADFPTAHGVRAGIGEHIDFARLEHPFVRSMIALRLARPDLDEWGTLP
jgi:carotenoid 1,2-hydratase